MKKIIVMLFVCFITMNNVYAIDIETQLKIMQKDIENLKNEVSELRNTRLDKTYPIGSIYETTTYSNAREVSSALGGTWEEYGKGKTLVAVDYNDDNFNVVNKTGGNITTILSSSNLPSHTHSIPALSGTAKETGAHTHTRGTMNITGSVKTRDFNVANHNLIFQPSGAFSVSYTSDSGTTQAAQYISKTPYYINVLSFDASRNWTGATSSNGAHTHNVITNTGTSGSVGSSTSFSNLPPYITVYRYKRIN